MPESPRWLLRHHRYEQFSKAMVTLGVGHVTEEQAERAAAGVEAAMVDWMANFALIEVFPVWQNAISLSGVLVCFAGLAVFAIVFIWKFLPETKGLAVEDIVRLFEKSGHLPPAQQPVLQQG